MTLSIKQKIIFAYTIVFGLVLIIFGFIIYQSVRQSEIERIDSNLKSYSVILQTEIEEQVSEGGPLNINEIRAAKAEGLQDVHIGLYDRKGNQILYDSLTESDLRWKDVLKGKNIIETIWTGNGHYYRSYWIGVESEGDTLFALQVSASMKEVNRAMDRLLFILIVVIPLALMITGFTAYLISRAAFRPVMKMAQNAREISASSLDKRLALPKARDEIYYLGQTLNEMISRIDSSFKSHRQFIADASHEIRTPLTILQTELELLDRSLSGREDKDSIRIALTEIGSLGKLTTSLLTLAKLDAAQLRLLCEPVRLDELLIECIQFMKTAADEKKIKIELLIDEAKEIKADKDKLKSVLINLIDNAIKYSLEGCPIRIEMVQIPGSKIQVTIQNKGILIKPSEQEVIFERFYRSDEVQSKIKGNGLGLTIAKEFVEMHNGSISVESDQEIGTKFKVEVPF